MPPAPSALTISYAPSRASGISGMGLESSDVSDTRRNCTDPFARLQCESSVLVNTYFERCVDQILDVARRFGEALDIAGLRYRVVGGLAVFLHVEQADPLLARLTRDVDVTIDRGDLERVKIAAEACGFTYRHAAGDDMFVDASSPKARSAVHLIFAGVRVRDEYLEPAPSLSDSVRMPQGILVAPVADLVRMKLTSFRLRDRVHVQDLDRAGLITAGIEAQLPEVLRARLADVRSSE